MGTIVKFSDSSFKSFEFEAFSFNHGLSMPLGYTEENRHMPNGHPAFQDVTLARYANSTSPLLNSLCARGQFIEEIRITMSHGKDAENKYEIVLNKCLLTSISVGAGSETPIETITMFFHHIIWNYVTAKNNVTTAECSVVE